MIERVEFNPNARQEIANSFDWYESREVGLGTLIRNCVLVVYPQLTRSLGSAEEGT